MHLSPYKQDPRKAWVTGPSGILISCSSCCLFLGVTLGMPWESPIQDYLLLPPPPLHCGTKLSVSHLHFIQT